MEGDESATAVSDSPAAEDNNLASRGGWLRAAVLGADDGIVSTASLIVGVAAASANPETVLTAGLAGLVAGALSMAAGEYVSVSSQRDMEEALRRREEQLAEVYPDVALTELAIRLQMRGIDPGLARRVVQQLDEPVTANIRLKYGLSEATGARPLQAALASMTSFAIGGVVPLLGLLADGPTHRILLAIVFAILALAISGALAADAGGAPRARAALRVVTGGGIAMAVSALVGTLVGGF